MRLVFQEHPDVQIGTLTFRRVPVILQFEDVPLIEVCNTDFVGWNSRFHLFHPDGTALAVVKGSRMFLTEDGKKAQLKLRHFPDVIACELDGRTLFELRHAGASALRTSAELYTPNGILVRTSDTVECLMGESGEYVRVGNHGIKNAVFEECPVGITISKEGKQCLHFGIQRGFEGELVEIDGVGQVLCKLTEQGKCRIGVIPGPGVNEADIFPGMTPLRGDTLQ